MNSAPLTLGFRSLLKFMYRLEETLSRWCKKDVKEKPLLTVSSWCGEVHHQMWNLHLHPHSNAKHQHTVWCSLFSPSAAMNLLVTKALFFLFFLNFSPQMEVDGPLSAQEQIIILYDIKLQCQQNLSNTDTEVTGKKKKKERKKDLSTTGKPRHRIHQK